MTNKDTIGSFASSLQAAFSALRQRETFPPSWNLFVPLRPMVSLRG